MIVLAEVVGIAVYFCKLSADRLGIWKVGRQLLGLLFDLSVVRMTAGQCTFAGLVNQLVGIFPGQVADTIAHSFPLVWKRIYQTLKKR